MAAPSSAAMELKVLISVLQSGNSLQTMLKQVSDLSQALSKLQQQAAGAGAGVGSVGGSGAGTAAAAAAANALGAASQAAAAGMGAAGAAAATSAVKIASLEDVIKKVTTAVKFMAGGFLALQSVRFLKNLADEAARVEMLTTVLHVVAKNAGYTNEQIDNVARSVQRMGITAESSAQSLTQLMQAGLKLDLAPKLARAAQDLAVVSGADSSTTFQRMILNIQQLDTLGLRWMGLVINRTEAENKFALSLGTSANALSNKQKQEALALAVIEKARDMEGAYLAAMGDVGKQLTSLKRYYSDITNEVGKHLLPAYSAIVSELSLFLAKMQDVAMMESANLDIAERLGEVVRKLARYFFTAVEFIVKHRDAILALTAAYASYWAMVAGKAVWTHMVTVVTTLTSAVVDSTKSIINATKATYAWIVALRLLNTTRAASTAHAGANAAGQLSFDFMKDGAAQSGGIAKKLRELIPEAGALATILKLLQRAWAPLTALFAEGGVTAALTGIGTAIASLTGLIVALVAALVAGYTMLFSYTDAGTEMGRVFGNVAKIFVSLGGVVSNSLRILNESFRSLIGTVKGVVDQFGLFLQILAKIPGNPINNTVEGLKTLNDWLGWIDTKLKSVNDTLEKYANFLGIVRAAHQGGGGGTADELNTLTDALANAREDLTEAEVKAAQTRKKKGEFSEDYKQDKKEYDERKKIITDLEKRREESFKKARQRDPAAAAEADRYARSRLRTKEYEDIDKAAGDARDRILRTKVTSGPRVGDLIITTKEFEEKRGQLNALLAQISAIERRAMDEARGRGPTGAMTPTIDPDTLRARFVAAGEGLEAAKATVGAVTTQANLKIYLELLDQLDAKLDANQRKTTARLRVEAGITAREGERGIYAKTEAIRVAAFRRQEALLSTHIETEIDLLRMANERVLALEKERFDRGQSSIEDYFAIRRELQQREYFLRVTQAQNEVASAKREIAAGIGFSIPEQIAAQQKLSEKQEALRRVIAAEPGQSTQLDVEQRNAELQATRALTDGLLDNAIAFGSEAAAMEKVEEQYIRRKEQLQRLRPDDRRNEQIAQDEKTLGQLKVVLDLANKRLEVDLDGVRTTERRVAVEKALLDVQSERTQLREQRGEISPLEAQRIRNTQILKQLQLDLVTLAGKRAELEGRQNYLREQRAIIEAAYLKRGLGPERLETILAVNTALGGTIEQISTLQAEVVTLEAKAEAARLRLESYAQELRMTFQSGLTDVLTEALTGWLDRYKSFLDTLANLGKSMVRKIAEGIAKEWAQKITEAIIKATGGPGNSVFEKIFKWLGLTPEPKQGETPDKPLYSWVTNWPTTEKGQQEQIAAVGGPIANAFSGLSRLAGVDIEKFVPLISRFASLFRNRGTGYENITNYFRPGAPPVFAEGGHVSGPGTGTSDSIPAMLSHGEYVVPAAATQQWLPLLEGIRSGKILPFRQGGPVQSIAPSYVIPRRYAGGGVVVSDAGASAVQTGPVNGNMSVYLDPESMNMTMRDWLEHEVARQQSRR